MEEEYLSLGVEYLGFLDGQLRNLKGYATLAHELIQNADDAKNATEISFDVCDDALIIENNGVFSDCGHMTEAECPWSSDPRYGHRCDFHRFRTTASGDKRRESNTTGAFGIGFISVYQITDRPELISNGRHWIIDPVSPTEKRIQARQASGQLGTRFRLPWAKDGTSEVRRRLSVPVIEQRQIGELLYEINLATKSAILFLRKIEKITLKQNGRLIKSIVRERENNQCLITEENMLSGEKKTQLWYLFHGDFGEKAKSLRAQNGSQIEEKRKADVTLAVPESVKDAKGLFHASLPTQHPIGLPFHINADFYPTPDRKRIIFERDYQGEWNRTAVEAAATIFANALPELQKNLELLDFWELLRQLQSQTNTSENNNISRFWIASKNRLEKLACILTAQHKRMLPQEARLLQKIEEEGMVLPVLKALNIEVVHPDLKSFATLLREIGVQYFDDGLLAEKLKRAGLAQEQRVANAPSWFNNLEMRTCLMKEILILHQRKRNLTDLLDFAIVETSDGWLRPPTELCRINEDDRSVFASLKAENHFASRTRNAKEILEQVTKFDVEMAIDLLGDTAQEKFSELWKIQPENILKIIAWFADRSAELRKSTVGIERLASLSIWPSGTKLYKLNQLVLPGGFHDPLQIANALEQRVNDRHNQWLRNALRARELTLESYLTDYVSQALNQDKELGLEQYQNLIGILLDNMGKIRDNVTIKEKLSNCQIVLCTDNKRRLPKLVYFEAPVVREVLGQTVSTVDTFRHPRQALYHDLLSWLGVVASPRPESVIERIKSIVAEPPTLGTRKTVQMLYEHIGSEWDGAYKEQHQAFALLKVIEWLPAQDKPTQWFTPTQIYSSFQDFLFLTQANFLDIVLPIQRRTSKFLDFLGVQSNPSVRQVVAHLMRAAETPFDVNKQVYVFLNREFKDPAVVQLQNRKCLLLDGIGYVAPSKVFWADHPFGRFRYRLSNEFREYGNLLNQLGVKDSPTFEDALAVLNEISELFGKKHRPLDDETYAVVIECWKLFNVAIEQETGGRGELLRSKLSLLASEPIIPDDRRLLNPPINMYFNDRPKLSEKFGEYIEHNLIDRISGIWQAMLAAGVRPLSQVVTSHIVETGNTWNASDLKQILDERQLLLLRVIEKSEHNKEKIGSLSSLRLTCATELKIQYSLEAFRRVITSESEKVFAYFDRNSHELFFVESQTTHWVAMARELAHALDPDADASQMAATLKEILLADSYASAHNILDELGFSNLTMADEYDTISSTVVSMGGVEHNEEPEMSSDRAEADQNISSDEVQTEDSHADVLEKETLLNQFEHSEPAPKTQNTMNGQNGAISPSPGVYTPSISGAFNKQSSSLGTQQGAASSNSTNGTHSKNGNQTSSPSGRLRTYVNHSHSDDVSQRETDLESISNIDGAGVRVVLEYEKSVGRCPQEMAHHHPGYDVQSSDQHGNILRYIEVKSTGRKWDERGVGLTDRQFQEAQSKRAQYWLYVVEFADSHEPILHRIQNPAEQVTQFLYDDGWKVLAEPDDEKVTTAVKPRSILDLKNYRDHNL